ncbi:MAG: histidine triad nucleotide-binding protein [Alphaproteobacteria bacterium]
MTRHPTATNPTIFGKIIRKEIPAKVVYEDAEMLAFHDIQPKAPVHIVVIPKQHMQCLRCADAADANLLGHMLTKIPEIAAKAGLGEGGYRVVTNAGEHAGQSVPHLHFHILGGGVLSGEFGAVGL